MNISKEKNLKLTAQEIHDIMDLSMQAAEINGFISTYDFNRALYTYAAIMLYNDRKDEIVEQITEGTYLTAWTYLLQDGTIEQLLEEYPDEMDYLAESGQIWYEEYNNYALSIRGSLDEFRLFSRDILSKNAEQLFEAQNNSDFKNTYEIADRWGLNNENPDEQGASLFIAD